MIIPWEEGQEEGPRASERIFLKYGTICFVKLFMFSVQKFSYSCYSKLLSVEVTRTFTSKRFPNKDLLLSRLLKSKNGNQI